MNGQQNLVFIVGSSIDMCINVFWFFIGGDELDCPSTCPEDQNQFTCSKGGLIITKDIFSSFSSSKNVRNLSVMSKVSICPNPVYNSNFIFTIPIQFLEPKFFLFYLMIYNSKTWIVILNTDF